MMGISDMIILCDNFRIPLQNDCADFQNIGGLGQTKSHTGHSVLPGPIEGHYSLSSLCHKSP